MSKPSIDIILLSGGLDSSTLAHKLIAEGHMLHGIYFNLGGTRNTAELAAAKIIANKLNIPLEIADLSGLRQLYTGYLPDPVIRMDGGDTIDPKPGDLLPYTKIPTGVAILHSVTNYLALLQGRSRIYLAYIKEQLSDYPNLREYLAEMPKTLALINHDKLPSEFVAPMLDLAKHEVVALANQLNVPLAQTWSCVRHAETHCGECYGCQERKRGFSESRIEDSTGYST